MNAPGQQSPIERLREIMRTLRSEEGCPWDREQDLLTLKKYLVEECYEVIDAIDRGDHADLCDELGDLLLQVVFQAQICDEEGRFTFDDVATAISEKLVRRHPHVFGDTSVADSDEVVKNWDAIKREEKGEKPLSILDGLSASEPALMKAQTVQKCVAKVGFDWDRVEDVVAKIDEELAEVKTALDSETDERVKEELGDLLFAVVNLCRFSGHYAEETLHGAVRRFSNRFRDVETRVKGEGREPQDCTLQELDAHWNEAKKAARSAAVEDPA